ncbi:MAG: hypothetical protein ACKVS6_00435 [Planctomycetota bacterium]
MIGKVLVAIRVAIPSVILLVILPILLRAMLQGAPASQPAQAANLRVVSAPENIQFGLPFRLVVERSWKTTDPAPAWSDAALAPLAIASKEIQQKNENGTITETCQIEARAFVREELDIPSLQLRIPVKSALPDPAGNIEDPPGPFEAPFPWKFILTIASIAILTILAAWILYIYWKRRAAIPKPVKAAAPIPAHEAALARLAALRRVVVSNDMILQQYYTEASSIVRQYIEDRYHVHAPEMTTEEFLNSELTNRILAREHRVLLSDYLNHCDLVKFARQPSTGADRDRLLAAAERFIQETRIDLTRESKMSNDAAPDAAPRETLTSAGAKS